MRLLLKKIEPIEQQEFRHFALPHLPIETRDQLREFEQRIRRIFNCNPDHKYAGWVLAGAFLAMVSDEELRNFREGK